MQRKLSINTDPKLLQYSAGYTYNTAMTLYSILHSGVFCLFLLKTNYFSYNIIITFPSLISIQISPTSQSIQLHAFFSLSFFRK